ncbi:4343_t:CDS:2 [Ambispora gerdemannii]|uniref:4343_t:CDS:1 n=1 Tax=Ambispora gerdemannii TaxID=144530 RepID=A0A9N9GCQ2_9GLOM|nr:4343_t:CDS:2 [Ambispora gerdemannii]
MNGKKGSSLTRYITDIMAFCFMVGTEVRSSFQVEGQAGMSISKLREVIYEKNKNDFKNFDANKLNLWKVDIPGDAENDKFVKLRTLESRSHNEDTIIQELEGQELTPFNDFGDIFAYCDLKNIRIIVQPQLPTTGKRRHEDSDSDEESGTRKKEKQTLKTLTSLLASSILQPPAVKIPSHKFYDRDQALNSILEVARYNYQGRNSPDHKNHKFILIPGGIGIGKTRMGWESKYLPSILSTRSSDTAEFVEALKDPCYVFIDLNNGSKYIKGFDDVEDPSVRIGTRVAVASGLVSECSCLHELLKTNNKELFRLSDVICEILQRRFKMQQRSVEAIIIHLDEYQLYINDVQQYQQISWINSRDFFKPMLRGIGSVMRGNNMKDEYGGKYFIVPICTGTSAIDVHFFTYRAYSKNVGTQAFELCLSKVNAKLMFLDKYDYSKQTTDEGRDLVVQGLKSHQSSDLNNEDVEKLSADFCNFVLNQQHFRIAMSDTGFIPKFIDDLLSPPTLTSNFDWGNQLFNKVSSRNITTVGKGPDFRLTSGTSIGELERSGLIYFSNTNDEWYTIVMPFMLLKVLNNKLLTSNVEDIELVFQDNLLFIPTHETPWQWQNFELLYGHFQKALIDSLIYVQESTIKNIEHEIRQLQKDLEEQEDNYEKIIIEDEISLQNQELDRQKKKNNWQLSDAFRGALGADTLLQRKVRLHRLRVFIENKKFLEKIEDVATFNNSVTCNDNVTRRLDEGIFCCFRGCANIVHHWILDSANNRKKLAIFSQIKYSERDATTTISTPGIKDWYDKTMKSVGNYENEYDVVLVLFTNRKCTGKINIENMPHLLLIYPKNIEKYLSPTFAHRGLVDRPSEK